MYHCGYRPQNMPTLPVSDDHCSLHHAPPPGLVAVENAKAPMARSGGARWTGRLGRWLFREIPPRRERSGAAMEKLGLWFLFLAGGALLFPGQVSAGGATWGSQSADVSAVESAARARYPRAGSMRQLMAADQRGNQLRENLRAARDSETATALGWAFFDGRYFVAADEWFGLALDWDTRNAAAAEGLVVAAYRSGDVAKAYRYAVDHAGLVPYARPVVARGLEQRAQTLTAAGRDRDADRLLRELDHGVRRTAFARPRLPFGSKGRTTGARSVTASPAPGRDPAAMATAEAQVKEAIARGRQFRAQSLARRAGISKQQLSAWVLEDLSVKVVAYQRAGDYRNALRMYSRAVRLGEPAYEARKANALSLYQMGEYRDAAVAFQELAKKRNDREVAEGLSQSLEKLETGSGTTAKPHGGLGRLIENCPLVRLLKGIGRFVSGGR